MKRPLLQTSLENIPLFRRGKVRDVYDLGDRLLMVATDRISAFDVVMPNGIPGKGVVLTQMSRFWFEHLASIPNHLMTMNVDEYPENLRAFRDQLEGRSMLVVKTKPIDVECVVRGYLVGSGWKDYQKTGEVCGIELPAGLREGDKFPDPIFTPASKEHTGHDVNISFAEVEERLGKDTAAKLRGLSMEIYTRAAAYSETRGFILVDTKFEFGFHDGTIILIDEVLTPDSSRFWRKEDYTPGAAPPQGFDKQFVRNYLESVKWDKKPPAPRLPDDVVENTRRLYVEAFEKLTGRKLDGQS